MDTSICRTTHQSVFQSTRKSVTLSVCNMASASVIPVCLSYGQSIHHPVNSSMTHQSVTPPISPVIHPSESTSLSDHLYTILPHPSGCPSSSDHSSTIYTSPSDCPSPPEHLYAQPFSPSDLLSMHNCLYNDPPSPSAVRLSSHTIHHTQDSSQSLAVMNGDQSHKAKKFRRAFTNYNLLLRI